MWGVTGQGAGRAGVTVLGGQGGQVVYYKIPEGDITREEGSSRDHIFER